MKAILKRLSSFQLILLGFAAVILTGALLLMLPISTASGESAAFSDALFTSVSAVCVTGLITQDTATYWSQFGQTIILLLIQVGGLGVVTAASAIALIAKRRINLRQRSTMQEATSAQQVGGVVKFTSFIFKTTFLIELIGVILLMPVFCKDFGFLKGLWYSLFHSISAFCNAGFDLLGVRTQFSSLTTYAANPLLNIVVMFLIISGGFGFATWEDIRTHRHYIKKYRMQSKVILVTTGILLFVPMLYFYFCEFSGWEMSLPEKLLASAFQAVTPRTAGFNTVNFSDMYQSSLIDLAGGVNTGDALEGDYWTEVSYETILDWNPEVIILPSGADYTVDDILNDAQLAGVTAVENGAVYAMPSAIEEWDSPIPSGILGAMWMTSVLHSDLYTQEEFCKDAAAFYEEFYGFTPDEALLK